MIRIVLADDHHLFRDGLARILNGYPDLEVVASVSSGEDAVTAVSHHQPDVILLDVNMPGIGGVGATQQIRQNDSEARILMLTVSERESDLFSAIRSGARGYLLKDSTSEQLNDAVRRVYAGEAIIAPVMAAKLFDKFSEMPEAPKRSPKLDELTDREQEILHLLTQGLSNKEIGVQLALSPHTVKVHLHRILEKLDLRSRVEAAAWAVRHGLAKRNV
ncbi:MAG: response regulator transcription factor [Ardenticatenaceae bacterium]|nr:response regulator transcription factor [Ardenticatenaceae bacterium]MCB9445786.1 response regulator transcription factor [Ardenticatenaceae bacterium]